MNKCQSWEQVICAIFMLPTVNCDFSVQRMEGFLWPGPLHVLGDT